MDDALLWLCIERIREDLQTRIPFGTTGEVTFTPDNENVKVRYQPAGDDQSGSLFQYPSPGIVISPPRRVAVGGDLNCKDDYRYPILLQFMQTDYHQFNEDRIRCCLKWWEQVAEYFVQNRLRGLAGVLNVTIGGMEWFQAKVFDIHKHAVWTIVLVVETRQCRNAYGRS